MLLDDIFPDLVIETPVAGRLKMAAAAGLLGLGALGAIARGPQPAAPSNAPQAAPPTKGLASDIDGYDRMASRRSAAQPRLSHRDDSETAAVMSETPTFAPNFPKGLRDQRERDPAARKAAFMQVMKPLIAQANAAIMADRRFVLATHGKPTASQRSRYDALMQEYDASNYNDLVARVDEIPPQLALAQSALETGWGTSDLAREQNAFFGQKAFPPGAGTSGVFAGFATPEDAIRAYMHNINTNDAYRQFRAERSWMRAVHIKLNPVDLAHMLLRYDQTGKPYTRKVGRLIVADRD